MQHDASYPREEPGAGNLHARIREGESRMAELLDQFPRKKVGRTELEEDSDRWSLENSGSETRTTGKKARRLPPPSVAAITVVARKLYRDNQSNPPNIVVAEQLIRQQLPGATRKLIMDVLKSSEFCNQRRRPGKQPK